MRLYPNPTAPAVIDVAPDLLQQLDEFFAPLGLEESELIVHMPPADEVERFRLMDLNHRIQRHPGLADRRDLAALVRLLFPATHYKVGSGGSHVYLLRLGELHRLAIICEPGSQGKGNFSYLVEEPAATYTVSAE